LICLTFDNLGGIAEGDFDPAHPALAVGLPRILALLERLGVRATFFVEGYAAEIFPEAVRSIARAGHEVALHAWRHEQWGELAPQDEERLLARGVEALGKLLGAPPHGFRPPGGRLTDASAALFAARGIDWVSTAEGRARGLPGAPFTWRRVDAANVIPRFGGRETPEQCFARWLDEARAHESRTPANPWVAVAHPFCAGLDPVWPAFERFAEALVRSVGPTVFAALGSTVRV
jgi:peptidoglycan/xylan/chitin deacetylase (PgdA/CDA1 family)